MCPCIVVTLIFSELRLFAIFSALWRGPDATPHVKLIATTWARQSYFAYGCYKLWERQCTSVIPVRSELVLTASLCCEAIKLQRFFQTWKYANNQVQDAEKVQEDQEKAVSNFIIYLFIYLYDKLCWCDFPVLKLLIGRIRRGGAQVTNNEESVIIKVIENKTLLYTTNDLTSRMSGSKWGMLSTLFSITFLFNFITRLLT